MKIGILSIDDEIVIVKDVGNVDAVIEKLKSYGRTVNNGWVMDFDNLPEGFGTIELPTSIACYDAEEMNFDF
ncbi:MAG TPA: hypothetical protein VKP88_03965 [Candidatus Paceibacterota bacterium]|nr:hypothetical protein [Candidatus Paceibacterota bacterium]